VKELKAVIDSTRDTFLAIKWELEPRQHPSDWR